MRFRALPKWMRKTDEPSRKRLQRCSSIEFTEPTLKDLITMTDQTPVKLMRDFRFKAGQQNAAFDAHAHPQSGVALGQLETGVLRYGDENAQTVIFLTSGVHGAEQAAGSWCQFDLMDQGVLNSLPKGIAVVLIHAINPWGAAAGRRYTEENVDLCRNFMAFDQALPNPLDSYIALQPLFDATPAQARDADGELARFSQDHGVPAFYAAVMSGQYRDADGIGYGGHGPTYARLTLEAIMLEHASTAQRIYALDYHTGVGPYAYGSIIGMQTGARLRRAKQVFGDWVLAPRENPPAGFIDVTGHSTDGVEALFPSADVLAVVLEVGTLSQDVFIQRLLAEHRLTRAYGAQSDHPDLAQARRDLVDFFVPRDAYWRAYLRHRGAQAFAQILEDATREQD